MVLRSFAGSFQNEKTFEDLSRGVVTLVMIPKNTMNRFGENVFTTHIDLKPTTLRWQQNVAKFMVLNSLLFSQKALSLMSPWVLNTSCLPFNFKFT